ncbi:MAG: hypothetical protein KGM98_01475 [Bacteroidota bacterium]|nr:hypothetical protein [Bacteroidota bacterium]
MKVYLANIEFNYPEDFMKYIPEHRTLINMLINTNVIESYAVSLESRRSWIVINAGSKEEVMEILSRSPLYKFWTFTIDELFLYDGQNFRLPKLQFN